MNGHSRDFTLLCFLILIVALISLAGQAMIQHGNRTRIQKLTERVEQLERIK